MPTIGAPMMLTLTRRPITNEGVRSMKPLWPNGVAACASVARDIANIASDRSAEVILRQGYKM
jgi:hypothetical protein